jgi:hypothetical protein
LRTHASINARMHACERVRVHSPACVCVCQHPLPQCMRACVFIRASGCAAAVTRMGQREGDGDPRRVLARRLPLLARALG